jgi:cell division inhibitor SepF
MSALRKAGVWLGLVEEEDDRIDEDVFDDEFADEEDDFAPPVRPRSLTRPAVRPGDRLRSAERELRERGLLSNDRDRDVRADRAAERSTDRGLGIERDRGYERRDERREPPPREEEARASVRQLARPASSGSGSISFPTHDNLALAPQVQLRERAVVGEEKGRRYQITTLHLTSYNEARTIGEHFRDGFPVIMNLTEMDEPDAKRLVDFAAGLAFGLRGSMERVTNRVFLLSPPNIQVSAEDKARIAEGGFFDQG